ncbi:hypothetical protein ACH5RR_039148 [Cinchona calisaya]|uniref:Uncharacterized protein n=1 Tax=Cinchona calisaya TaxID=153742 RepID=A0ABD2Y1I4_9GENT
MEGLEDLLKKFVLSSKGLEGVDLGQKNVQRVIHNFQRSLIGKLIGEKFWGGSDWNVYKKLAIITRKKSENRELKRINGDNGIAGENEVTYGLNSQVKAKEKVQSFMDPTDLRVMEKPCGDMNLKIDSQSKKGDEQTRDVEDDGKLNINTNSGDP